MRRPMMSVWLPLFVAGAIFALRESGRPSARTTPGPGVSVALPMLRGSAVPKREVEYELDQERSSIRFLVVCDGHEHLFTCPAAEGRLVVSPDLASSLLELRIDLAGLRSPEGITGAGECDLWHVLGTNRDAQISYRGALVTTASTPLACLERKLWDGTLRFGRLVVRQPMALWQTALPGQPLRLQGQVAVRSDAYGLPRHSVFALLREPHTVTLGLDLAWKRRAR